MKKLIGSIGSAVLSLVFISSLVGLIGCAKNPVAPTTVINNYTVEGASCFIYYLKDYADYLISDTSSPNYWRYHIDIKMPVDFDSSYTGGTMPIIDNCMKNNYFPDVTLMFLPEFSSDYKYIHYKIYTSWMNGKTMDKASNDAFIKSAFITCNLYFKLYVFKPIKIKVN